MIYLSSLIFLLKAITCVAYITVHDIPDPKDTAVMARFIVHISNWTSVSYISNQTETRGSPLAALFSVSDGPVDHGSGVPYFYVSRLQQAVTDLMDSNDKCSLMMSLAQTSICNNKDLDPEDPRCAQVVLAGTFQRIHNNTNEYEIAKNSVFSRHPSFIDLPENHHFFFAKLNITYILVQDTFGGPSVVSVAEYFHIDNRRAQIFSHSNSNRNNIFIFTSLLIFACSLSNSL